MRWLGSARRRVGRPEHRIVGHQDQDLRIRLARCGRGIVRSRARRCGRSIPRCRTCLDRLVRARSFATSRRCPAGPRCTDRSDTPGAYAGGRDLPCRCAACSDRSPDRTADSALEVTADWGCSTVRGHLPHARAAPRQDI